MALTSSTSKIRLAQARIAQLLVARTDVFAVAPSAAELLEGAAPAADLVNVIVDLPGDIDGIIDQALAAAGIAVIVWTPSYRTLEGASPSATDRRMLCNVWVTENVLINRQTPGAMTAEEVCELIDELVTGKPNGLTAHSRGALGVWTLADPGVAPLKAEESSDNSFRLAFATDFKR